jgi:hypothetical protein
VVALVVGVATKTGAASIATADVIDLPNSSIFVSQTPAAIMTTITDEYMMQMLTKTKPYCIVLLKPGPNIQHQDLKKIIWEHGRRNFQLRAEGLLSIVCPVSADSDVNGVGIFNTTIEETKKIMDEDPAVKEGVFVYQILSCRSFPGDRLAE